MPRFVTRPQFRGKQPFKTQPMPAPANEVSPLHAQRHLSNRAVRYQHQFAQLYRVPHHKTIFHAPAQHAPVPLLFGPQIQLFRVLGYHNPHHVQQPQQPSPKHLAPVIIRVAMHISHVWTNSVPCRTKHIAVVRVHHDCMK